MAYISEVNSIKMKIELGRLVTDSQLIKGIIDKHRASKFYKDAISGRRYYDDQHDILNKNFREFTVKGVKKQNPNAANNRITNEFHTEMVDQKVDYIAGNSPQFTTDEPEAEKFADVLNTEFKTYIETTLIDWLIGTSNSGNDALLVFINEKGEFDYMVCPGEQLIIDKDENGKTLSIMRFYYVDDLNDRGGLDQIIRVEVWNDKEVYYFVQNGKDGDFVMDKSEPDNPKPHFKKSNTATNTNAGMGWGQPPFIFLPNNNGKKSDLNRVKDLIDAYDLLISKGMNTIQDLQEVVYVLKGYEGTDLADFLETLKVNKAIKVDGLEGGVDTLTVDLPVEAIESLEKMIRKNIYAFGRGIDFSDENFSGDVTGIALKYKFARLDLKANQLIRQLQLAILKLCWFYAKYQSVKSGGSQDFLKVYDKVNLQINKRLMINEAEMITNVQSSVGIVDEETLLENHPFVDDVQKVLDALKKERQSNLVNLDNLDE
jgi:SPP1 family phage portal protein